MCAFFVCTQSVNGNATLDSAWTVGEPKAISPFIAAIAEIAQ